MKRFGKVTKLGTLVMAAIMMVLSVPYVAKAEGGVLAPSVSVEDLDIAEGTHLSDANGNEAYWFDDTKTLYVTAKSEDNTRCWDEYSGQAVDILFADTVTYVDGFRGFEATTVVIPESVTVVAQNAFASSSIPNVIIEGAGEMKISSCAFMQSDVTNLSMEGVMSIGEEAFYQCVYLTGDLILPHSVLTIGTNAFMGCSSINGTISIGNSTTRIYDGAFYGCTNATGIILGSSLERIGEGAFLGCRNVTGTVAIPNSVTRISSEAFAGMSSVSTFRLGNGVAILGEAVFAVSSNNPVDTTVMTNNAYVKAYDWAGDYRTPNFVGYAEVYEYAVPSTFSVDSSMLGGDLIVEIPEKFSLRDLTNADDGESEYFGDDEEVVVSGELHPSKKLVVAIQKDMQLSFAGDSSITVDGTAEMFQTYDMNDEEDIIPETDIDITFYTAKLYSSEDNENWTSEDMSANQLTAKGSRTTWTPEYLASQEFSYVGVQLLVPKSEFKYPGTYESTVAFYISTPAYE